MIQVESIENKYLIYIEIDRRIIEKIFSRADFKTANTPLTFGLSLSEVRTRFAACLDVYRDLL